jgi:hypothetical protein
MSRKGLTVVEGLLGALTLSALLLVMWPLFRTIVKSESQLANLTGPALATSVLRERLRWDLELAGAPERLGRDASSLVLADGSGVDLVGTDGAPVAWRFDAKLRRFTRNGEPVGPQLEMARFARAGDHAVELNLVHAKPSDRGDRLVLRLPPALRGAHGWVVRSVAKPNA